MIALRNRRENMTGNTFLAYVMRFIVFPPAFCYAGAFNVDPVMRGSR